MQIKSGLCSSKTLKEIAECAEMPYMLLTLDASSVIEISPESFTRMVSVMSDTGAAIVYSDYRSDGPDGPDSVQKCIDYRPGSVRDDFSFGPAVLVNTKLLHKAVASIDECYEYAAWYDARLRLSELGEIIHIPEPLYTVRLHSPEDGSEATHFSYVDPRNAIVQTEMEQAFTSWLKRIGAWLPQPSGGIDFGDDFPVEASVIIPVRNRVDTIGDAIFSALDQTPGFDFNVIVVDNHSTDGTTEVIRRLADDPRLIHLIPEETTLGIGGCWNRAISDPRCGRFAVQLDSDDLYSSPHTLSAIVECFRKQQCAMVVGSYSLTDFNLNPIPPGIIDHKEWTDANGHNNLLRVNGIGAPRAFSTAIVRRLQFPDVCYGEDYAMALRISRSYRIGRIFDVLYLCRRWDGNSDARPTRDKLNRFNTYKDTLRSWEITARQKRN